ncbi:DUF4269 domain-containing protein [Aeromonas salmonicida]|uniref:DUF4269 domain-containing protein n=1 Tax=Aeromonas salmonicida TaxID=645 RepID=UPI001C5FD753|nr:DUF4269 domain-containing protein [Aeromonas salmonicida]
MQTDLCLLRDELTAAPAAVFPSARLTASPNWRRLDYLAQGNPRQRAAHALLNDTPLWGELQSLCLDVALVSTLAIGLDRPGSDLDILCQHSDPAALADLFAQRQWQSRALGSDIWLLEQTLIDGEGTPWPIELYVTPARVDTLNGWRHLSLMAALIEHFGHDFYQTLRTLRLQQGLKGEAAICRLLKLPGDPYQALLTLEGRDFDQLDWRPQAQAPSAQPATFSSHPVIRAPCTPS